MKAIRTVTGTLVIAALAIACNNKDKSGSAIDSTTTTTAVSKSSSSGKSKVVPGNYTNLETGKEIYVMEDPETGYAVDSLTKLPVTFYISTAGDTLNTMGDVSHAVMKADDGTWTISDNAKVKVDGDKIKIKDGDTKIKIDGDETKIKDGDYKKKTDGDQSKEKEGDTKVKTADGKVKVKN